MPWKTTKPAQPNPEARGLGPEHRALRAALLAALVEGTPCPFHGVDPKCTGGMYRSQKLHLDHATPRRLGGDLSSARLAHAGCNVRAGAKLGNHLSRQAAAQPVPQPPSRRSRPW